MWFGGREVWSWQVLCVVFSWWLVKVGQVELVDWDLSVVVCGRPCSKCLASGAEC